MTDSEIGTACIVRSTCTPHQPAIAAPPNISDLEIVVAFVVIVRVLQRASTGSLAEGRTPITLALACTGPAAATAAATAMAINE